MLEDRYGNKISTSSKNARDGYQQGVDLFLAAQSGVEEAFCDAIEADDGFALAHIGLARARQALGKISQAHQSLADARSGLDNVTAREARHIHILGLLIEGDAFAARQAVYLHTKEYPRDAMVAQTCTSVFGLIGFSGEAGREAEQLAFTTALAPHYGDDWWFLAQHAFAQMEAGQLGPAEANIEKALQSHALNANAAHIRAHLYYENGEAETGYKFLTQWWQNYDKNAVLHCHISWHVALWALEQGDIDKMWQVIDANVDPAISQGPSLNILSDMVAILYRANLKGVEIPQARWRSVSEFAVRVFPEPSIAFGDVHAALAHAMAGNSAALEKIISNPCGPAGNRVVELAIAFGAIGKEQWYEAGLHLAKAMSDHERIGGSRAQRDLIEFAMLGVLVKQNRADEANMLITMRRPISTSKNAVLGL